MSYYRYGTNPEPYPLPLNTLWRYASGETALVEITSTHVKGYHGAQCMGGSIYVTHDNIKPASLEDYKTWFDNAHWRKRF